MKKLSLVICAVLASILMTGCSSKKSDNKNIAVFVPGIIADSPTYEKLVTGVKNGVESFNQNKADNEKAKIFIMEVGTNQAEWAQKLTALAAEQRYDVIISSNPSIPDLAKQVLEQFPKQKFIILDASCKDNPNIMTKNYDQAQQGYVTGYIAGLMSKSHKVALISAQDYPVMNNVIFPSFKKGAQDAFAKTSVDYRVVGNWYDATKGAEIADALSKTGVDVFLPVCGGASQGVIASAKNNGTKIAWFDSNGFSKAPDVIISSTQNRQEKLACEVTIEFLEGKTEWGTSQAVGMKEGYVEFVNDHEAYIANVPSEIRKQMDSLVSKIKSGEFVVQ